MRTLRCLPLCLLASCASLGSSGPDLPLKLAPRPTEPAITTGDLMSRLYVFSDDSMLGRESTTLGNVKATEYVASEMRRIGLQPGGEGGTFFQAVPIQIARLDTSHPLTVDGEPLVLGRDVLPFYASNAGPLLPRGGTTRSLDGARVVYGGHIGGAMIPPAQAAGKLVVFTVGPLNGVPDWRFYRVAPVSAYGDAAGIAAVTLDIMPASRKQQLGQSQGHIRSDATGAAPVVLIVSTAAAQRLLGVPSLGNLTPGAEGRVVHGDLTFRESDAPFPSRNVIGILPGSDATRYGQFVAIGAHNDHIGIERRPLDHDSVLAFNTVARRQGVQDEIRAASADEWRRINQLRDSLRQAHGGARPDSVNNGADDDGSGTVALLEIAERFASAPTRPRRSLLFVSHTGEEKGLWGSDWFTEHPTVVRDSIVAQLNMDMVGRGKAGDAMGRGPNNVQIIGSRRLSTQLGDLIDSVNASRGVHMDIDPQFDANGHPLNRYCRSDHYMYARYGIPITYFSLGYHTDYHQVTDEAQYIDYDHLARIAQFVHDVAETVANRPARLVVDRPKPDPRGGCRQ